MPPYIDITGGDLGGRSFQQGNYKVMGLASLSTGISILDAYKEYSASWNFNIGSTLTMSQDTSISIINVNEGATLSVMWNVGASAAFSQGVGIPAFARTFPITRTVVDAPAPLSVFVLGMIGFASSRFKKQA
jgi:hypothetical protein